MRSNRRRPPDHITLMMAAILSLAGSQVCEGITWPIGALLRAVFLAITFISISIALYFYDSARKT